MNKKKIYNIIEYVSLALILSFFIIHNIFLVLIGIILSSYLINISFINTFMKLIKQKIKTERVSGELIMNNKIIKIDSNQIQLTKKDSKLSLVETIEELGYIPSLNNNEDSNAS